jgi:hypothetical protein
LAGLPQLKLAAQDGHPWCAPSCPPRRAFVASDARRRGQLCTVCNPPGIHLRIGESCSDKRSHFCLNFHNRPIPVRTVRRGSPARVDGPARRGRLSLAAP